MRTRTGPVGVSTSASPPSTATPAVIWHGVWMSEPSIR